MQHTYSILFPTVVFPDLGRKGSHFKKETSFEMFIQDQAVATQTHLLVMFPNYIAYTDWLNDIQNAKKNLGPKKGQIAVRPVD